MYLLILFGSLFNLVFLGLFGRIVHTRFLFSIVIGSLSLSFVACQFMFYEVIIMRSPCEVPLFNWVQASYLNVVWTLLFDTVSTSLIYVVVFISLLVHLYSLDYMQNDPHIVRFLFCLSIFTFFMLIMASAGNVLQLFLGWEGVGLASYLLINFWYSRSEANKSAMKAMIVNRIGDFGVYMGLLMIVYLFKSFDLSVIFSTCDSYVVTTISIFGYPIRILTIIACCIFLGTVGKSAQIGLHMWLPDAMEGPTPVSALLHAATMVTAGVFILIRFSLLFDCVPIVLLVVGVIGTLTSVFAGLSACVQFDIKKIIAYSTCSHLGIMLCLCGLSHFHVAIFHLFNHAFFKALLFLSAGAIIHALRNEQDIRKMGGLVSILPFTYSMFLIGSLSAIGFPSLSGFFSKDLGWELIFTRLFLVINGDINFGFGGPTVLYYYSVYMFIVFNFILILSVLYSFRLIFIVFSSSFNGFKVDVQNAHEPTLFMLSPLVILSFFSIFAGFLFKDVFVGIGNSIWFQVLPDSVLNYDLNAFKEILFAPDILNYVKFTLRLFTFVLSMLLIISLYYRYIINYTLKGISLFDSIVSSFSRNHIVLKSRTFYNTNFDSFVCFFSPSIPYLMYRMFARTLSKDHVHYKWFSKVFMYMSYHITFKTIDRGFLEVFGPFGIVQIVSRLSKATASFKSKHFYSFVFLAISFFLIGIVIYYYFSMLDLLLTFFVIIVFSLLKQSGV